uniref:zinc finger protein OZF-like isoform X1 n=1 Tax=Gasterosteus aculeatus aculeatus TaxID=481459 RepID=UPI001A98F325|nr:zinc finger protein OZF-like isoform X1 [Gasterosteus aculeatus aculeatus]
MSSVENLREFVNERLSAAAEEIFGVFKRTVVEYQEEIDRQRRLLDVFWKPEVRLHRIELPQSRVCKEEELLSEQQLCLQERKPSLDQEDPDPPEIKEEQEELCTSPEGEQLEPKQEAFTLTPTCEERGHGEDQLLDSCTDETESVVQETSLEYISVESTAVVELNNDHQLLSHNPHESDGRDQKGVKLSLTSNKEPAPLDEKPFLRDCGKYFQLKNSLLGHVRRTHRVDEPYVCNTCGKRFPHESVLKAHKRVHSDEKPFSCELCGKEFRYNSDLKAHMKVHNGERPYSCTTCGKTFSRPSHLKAHIRLHSGEKPFSCITCGKTFTQKSQLKCHTSTHTGERPYSCNTCGKRFSYESVLKAHKIVHSEEKPFSCKTCGKYFKCSYSLKAHMKVHNGERPYSCTTCGKTFTQSSNLKSHVRTHSGEKPHSCTTCGKKFTRSSNLKSHIRIHSGERPYSCITCGKTFSRTARLKRHVRIHTGEKPYS